MVGLISQELLEGRLTAHLPPGVSQENCLLPLVSVAVYTLSRAVIHRKPEKLLYFLSILIGDKGIDVEVPIDVIPPAKSLQWALWLCPRTNPFFQDWSAAASPSWRPVISPWASSSRVELEEREGDSTARGVTAFPLSFVQRRLGRSRVKAWKVPGEGWKPSWVPRPGKGFRGNALSPGTCRYTQPTETSGRSVLRSLC